MFKSGERYPLSGADDILSSSFRRWVVGVLPETWEKTDKRSMTMLGVVL